MPINKEYSNNYTKTTESCLKFCRDEPNTIIKDSESFKL